MYALRFYSDAYGIFECYATYNKALKAEIMQKIKPYITKWHKGFYKVLEPCVITLSNGDEIEFGRDNKGFSFYREGSKRDDYIAYDMPHYSGYFDDKEFFINNSYFDDL